MLSSDALKVLKFYWTSDPADEDPEFLMQAVQAGVRPEKFVESTISTIRELETEGATRIADNIQDNFEEACRAVAGILGFH